MALLFVSLTCSSSAHADPDKPFKQAVSVKYLLPESLKDAILKKVVVDYNDVVYVLSNKGLFRVQDKSLVKDLRFTPLSQKIPVDITVQEGAGHLYYLLEDKVLTNGYAGVPYTVLPKGKYDQLAVAADGAVLLSGKQTLGLIKNNVLSNISLPENETIRNVYVHAGVFYVLGLQVIYRLNGNQLSVLYRSNDIQTIAFQKSEIIIGTANGFYGIHNTSGNLSFALQSKVPVPDIRCLWIVDGNLWAGTEDGAYMKEAAGSYRYYASLRWLQDNYVLGISSDSKGNVYCLSATGLNQIGFLNQTLSQKTAYYENKIRQRHIRYGLISEVFLQKPGDLETAEMKDTDNDGLWSSFYLGSQAFRYAVTKEKTARRYAWESFEAFERLLTINPLKGFPSRTFERIEYRNSDPHAWRKSQDPEWEWKGTTSSDEFVGHIFAAAVMNQFVAETPAEKKRVADFIDKILTHIIDNNYYFVDADGKPTLWGRWNPEYINWYPQTVSDRKLGSTTIIAGLQLGYALTGKSLYKKEAMRLMNEYGYLKNIMVECKKIQVTPGYVHMGVTMGDGWNHSDDEMAFLTYWVLYHYAFTDTLKKQYAVAIKDHWQAELPERDGLWNLIAKGTAGVYDKESTMWYLHEFPIDLVRWSVKNSQRKDLEFLPENLRGQTTKIQIPLGEQPMHRHNTNPFQLDGGDGGRAELAGDEYLLPYWMARYLKVIQ
jgi:hypothetical protein